MVKLTGNNAIDTKKKEIQIIQDNLNEIVNKLDKDYKDTKTIKNIYDSKKNSYQLYIDLLNKDLNNQLNELANIENTIAVKDTLISDNRISFEKKKLKFQLLIVGIILINLLGIALISYIGSNNLGILMPFIIISGIFYVYSELKLEFYFLSLIMVSLLGIMLINKTNKKGLFFYLTLIIVILGYLGFYKIKFTELQKPKWKINYPLIKIAEDIDKNIMKEGEYIQNEINQFINGQCNCPEELEEQNEEEQEEQDENKNKNYIDNIVKGEKNKGFIYYDGTSPPQKIMPPKPYF